MLSGAARQFVCCQAPPDSLCVERDECCPVLSLERVSVRMCNISVYHITPFSRVEIFAHDLVVCLTLSSCVHNLPYLSMCNSHSIFKDSSCIFRETSFPFSTKKFVSRVYTSWVLSYIRLLPVYTPSNQREVGRSRDAMTAAQYAYISHTSAPTRLLTLRKRERKQSCN